MFKLNQTPDYAIVVLEALARRQGDILVEAQVAEFTDLNQPTVAIEAKTLVATDFLDTQPGVHGGYRLSRKAAIISLVQIVEAVEGPLAAKDCVDGAEAPCTVSNCCLLGRKWSRVNRVVKDALTKISLEDVISPAQLLALADQEQVMVHKAPSAQQSEMLT